MSFRNLITILFLFVFIHSVLTKFPCPLSLSVDITDGIETDSHIIKDNIVYPSDLYFTIDNDTFGCICNITKCIRKCCLPNEVYYRSIDENEEITEKCIEGNSSNTLLDLIVYKETTRIGPGNLNFVYNKHCDEGSYRLQPDLYPDDNFTIQENGSIFFESTQSYYSQDMFCVDNFVNEDGSTSFSVIMCFGSQPLSHIVISVGMYDLT